MIRINRFNGVFRVDFINLNFVGTNKQKEVSLFLTADELRQLKEKLNEPQAQD